jgi:hypothetical protein
MWVEPRLRDSAIEELACGPDERLAALVLDITRLLADQHEPRADRPLAEHCLRRVLVEMAALAVASRRTQSIEVRSVRQEVGC